jgi:hypothetical protein
VKTLNARDSGMVYRRPTWFPDISRYQWLLGRQLRRSHHPPYSWVMAEAPREEITLARARVTTAVPWFCPRADAEAALSTKPLTLRTLARVTPETQQQQRECPML